MGDDFVVAMCHHIEDPTFDATGWATNPRLRMRPIHRPPRAPTDRHPHCAWTVDHRPRVRPHPRARPAGAHRRDQRGAALPLAVIDGARRGARRDARLHQAARRRPPPPRLRHRGAAGASTTRSACRATCSPSRSSRRSRTASAPRRRSTCGAKQFVGVAGVAAERLKRAFGLGADRRRPRHGVLAPPRLPAPDLRGLAGDRRRRRRPPRARRLPGPGRAGPRVVDHLARRRPRPGPVGDRHRRRPALGRPRRRPRPLGRRASATSRRRRCRRSSSPSSPPASPSASIADHCLRAT